MKHKDSVHKNTLGTFVSEIVWQVVGTNNSAFKKSRISLWKYALKGSFVDEEFFTN
jgi:hypothetical protein